MKTPRSLSVLAAPENKFILGSSFDPKIGLPSIPHRSVDHVICDPPYEENVHAGGISVRTETAPGKKGDPFDPHRRVAEAGWRTELGFAAMKEADREFVSKEMVRICKGWILVFCSIDGVSRWLSSLTEAGARRRSVCIWIKEDATPRFTGDGPSYGFEAIVTAWNGPGKSVWCAGGKVGIYIGSRRPSKNRRHPTEKPAYLMEALVSDFTKPGQLICDPYAGGASTLIAAKRLGRRYLGWEMDEGFHKSGSQALDGTREQLRLFERTKPRLQKLDQLVLDIDGSK